MADLYPNFDMSITIMNARSLSPEHRMALTELRHVALLDRDARVGLVGVHRERAPDVLYGQILQMWIHRSCKKCIMLQSFTARLLDMHATQATNTAQ